MSRILLVEDDKLVANIYRNKLVLEGYQVEIGVDGEAGLNLFRSFKPDAVILDLMLPKMSGVELTKKIRLEPGAEKLPVIVFSNTYLTNMVKDAWNAGATKCLSKANSTPKQLIDTVRGVLGGAPAPAAGPATVATSTASSSAKSAPAQMNQFPPGDDSAVQAEMRGTMVNGMPATIGALRNALQAAIKSDAEDARVQNLLEIGRKIRGVATNACIAGMPLLAQMADALDALLRELCEKPKTINTSTLRTVASAIDSLENLAKLPATLRGQEFPPAQVLVVDDEPISRRAVSYALEKAKLQSVAVESPNAAYDLLLGKKFDLVILDVDMPGMTGFELCAKLRELSAHKLTPVVFVTSLNDLESRAHSTMSGGNDFIAKPFLFMELAVKSLIHLFRRRTAVPKAQ